MRWGAFLFRLQRKGWLPVFPLTLHPPAEWEWVSFVCLVTRRGCLFVFSVPTRQGCNWTLPVPPSRSPGKTLPQPISSHCSYANGPWTHGGPSGTSVLDNVCVGPLHLPASLSLWLLCVMSVYCYSDRLLTGHTERNTVVTQLSCRLPHSPHNTHTQSSCQDWAGSVPLEHTDLLRLMANHSSGACGGLHFL